MSSRLRQLSPLLARYNGFMLGHFMAMAAFPSLRTRYPILRRRVNDFLGEVGLSTCLPTDVAAYQADVFTQLEGVLTSLRKRSPDCAHTAWLSAAVIFKARGVDAFGEDDLLAAADLLHIAPQRVLAYERAVPRHTPVAVAEVLAPGMQFLHAFLAGVRQERRTCFVAMPFCAPFERRYEEFYRPALRELGFRAVRAWGGVGMESYLEVVLMLLNKSGACLADVTGRNPNVLYELGAAQGMDKPVYILNEGHRGRLPANISEHTALRFHYRPKAAGWPGSEIRRFAAQTALAEYVLAETDQDPST